MNTEIILSTLNARYSHCSFGLRYLYANLKELKENSKIVEFTISQNARDIAEQLLSENPKVIGFGVYIWNTRQTYDVVSILKRVAPEIKIILGGPEVSYETEEQPLCQLADLTLQGEADFLFYDVCKNYLCNSHWPEPKQIKADLPDIQHITLPYDEYSDHDIQHRVIYVEASRGCPYKCEYCLSSLDKSVRSFELERFLSAMEKLIARGARQFKFIDRTFNLSIPTSSKILNFFLERIHLGLFLHFEMVPDRLPIELRELISQFPKGALQFEIGIQTWNPEVAKLVSRRQNYALIESNFAFLNQIGTVHTHADLIAGLPGETLESFAAGFDAVAALKPDEIQVGILKRLKGTPIIRHDQEWQMVYQDQPPFQVLKTRHLNYQTLQRIARFAHYWDLVANSGNFIRTFSFIVNQSRLRNPPSLFWEFDQIANFLATRHPQGHSIALIHLVESLWEYFHSETAHRHLMEDYIGPGRSIPHFMKSVGTSAEKALPDATLERKSATPKRQKKHLRNEVVPTLPKPK